MKFIPKQDIDNVELVQQGRSGNEIENELYKIDIGEGIIVTVDDLKVYHTPSIASLTNTIYHKQKLLPESKRKKFLVRKVYTRDAWLVKRIK